MPSPDPPTTRGRVLVIEDELQVGLDVQMQLSEAGFEVVGPVMTLGDAVKAAESSDWDAAVVDANLNGQNAGPVASILTQRGIPMLIVSGYARGYLPLAFAGAPLMAKPFHGAELIRIVKHLCHNKN